MNSFDLGPILPGEVEDRIFYDPDLKEVPDYLKTSKNESLKEEAKYGNEH